MLLRPLSVSDEEQALRAHEELAQDGFEFLFELEQGAAWPVYRGRLESQRLGVGLHEGRVPATFLVAEAEGQIVGRVSIRHELNAYLSELVFKAPSGAAVGRGKWGRARPSACRFLLDAVRS